MSTTKVLTGAFAALVLLVGVVFAIATLEAGKPGPACAPPRYSGCGFPDASNTGVGQGAALTASADPSGYVITQDNTVIRGWDFTGYLDVEANNVTIQDSRLTGTTWWGIRYGASNPRITGLRVLHSTLLTVTGQGPDHGGYDYGISNQTDAGTLEVGWDNISGYKDGVDVGIGSVHDSYIHDLSVFGGAHDQDIYVYPNPRESLLISHNTLITGTQDATAAIYIAPDGEHQHDVTIRGNWLAGGAYCIYGGDTSATKVRVTQNAFSTELHPDGGLYGTDAYWQAGNAGNSWDDNGWINGPNQGHPVTP